MKVCYYNWVDFDDSLKRGGGVTIYQRNLLKNNNNCYFISSGVYYKPPFHKVSYEIDGRRARIYNSPVLAPAHLSFGSEFQINSNELDNVFIELINRFGGFDIIHFNNLEGIGCSLLKKIKDTYPAIKIVLSIHNYYPFCPQVNLWHKEYENCHDFNEGRKCINCVHINYSDKSIKKAYFLGELLRTLKIDDNSFLFKTIWKYAVKFNKYIGKLKFLTRRLFNFSYKNVNVNKHHIDTYEQSKYFYNRRDIFVTYINMYVDNVITVSDRVRSICLNFGIIKDKCATLYIGTEHAKFYKEIYEEDAKKNKIFTIAYLGYMRADKGFPFLLTALENIDINISKNIKLVVAAPKNNYLFDRLMSVSEKFYGLIYYDGYNHDNLNDVLNDVDLGIVPPLWEDNLPQVAIEMHCRNIPILTSSTGGASELHGKNNDFIFVSGDVKSFKSKLETIVVSGINRYEYFRKSRKPLTMQEHIEELYTHYNSLLEK